MPSNSADFVPANTGLNLGSSTLRWNGYLQNVDISSTVTLGPSSTLATSGAINSTGTITADRFVSTVITGTAPIAVASSTKCANLNADLLDGTDWTSPGPIGFGTPGPAYFTTIQGSGQITSTLAGGTAPFVVTSNTKCVNLNADLLDGGDWASPGSVGSTTPAGGAFTTLTTTPVTGGTLKVGGAIACDTTPVTVNANSTGPQTMITTAIPAAIMNTVGRTMRVFAAGLYTTQAGQTPTMVIDLTYGGGTMVAPLSTATTASQTNMPWELEGYITTVTTGAAGTMEAHAVMNIRLGSGAGAASTFQDTNTAVSIAIDLTQAQVLLCRVTFSTNAATANICTQRLQVVELMN